MKLSRPDVQGCLMNSMSCCWNPKKGTKVLAQLSLRLLAVGCLGWPVHRYAIRGGTYLCSSTNESLEGSRQLLRE